MATIRVSLPDPMRDWVEAQVRAGRSEDAGDYVRALISDDQQRQQNLIDALIEGERSRTSRRSPDDIRADVKKKLNAGRL